MELWLDTIDREAIDHAKECGLLFGITTNPSIISKSSQPLEEILEDLLNYQSGPVAVQVTASKSAEMVEQAKDLYDFSQRLIVKIPVTPEGLKAISTLAHVKIPTMATSIFESFQGFLAAQTGASYLAPYYSHIGENRIEVIRTLQTLLQNYNLQTKVLVAALSSFAQVQECAGLGVAAVTLKAPIYYDCLKPPAQTLKFLAKFEEDWKQAPASKLLPREVFFG